MGGGIERLTGGKKHQRVNDGSHNHCASDTVAPGVQVGKEPGDEVTQHAVQLGRHDVRGDWVVALQGVELP